MLCGIYHLILTYLVPYEIQLAMDQVKGTDHRITLLKLNFLQSVYLPILLSFTGFVGMIGIWSGSLKKLLDKNNPNEELIEMWKRVAKARGALYMVKFLLKEETKDFSEINEVIDTTLEITKCGPPDGV